jgi:hypothetical protein
VETQKTIHEWAEATFGPSTALDRIIRCNVECGELLSAIHTGATREHVLGEIGDVQIIFDQVKHSVNMTYDPAWSFALASPLCLAASINSAMSRLVVLLDEFDDPLLIDSTMCEIQDDLAQLATVLQVDLRQCVDDKMKINRARTWKRLESGRFQHA